MRRPNPYASPYPTDPSFEVIGEGLGRALFGDPVAREAQQRAEADREVALARARQARSAAGYDDARTRGVNQQYDASINFAQKLAEGFAPIPDMSTGGSLDDISLSLGKGVALEEQGILPPPPPVHLSNDERIRGLAPALFGYAAQMQGDKVDPNKIFGGIAAVLGGEELARRGLVAQGHTPGKDFALTPDRADDIRSQGYGADYRQATDVARINNASDIPVAEIRARGGVDAARVRADGTVAAAGVRAATPRSTAARRGAGATTAAKAPKPIPVSVSKQLDQKVAALIDEIFGRHTEASRKEIASGWRARAGRYYQLYGDTGQVMDRLRERMIAANKLVKAKPSAASARTSSILKKYDLDD